MALTYAHDLEALAREMLDLEAGRRLYGGGGGAGRPIAPADAAARAAAPPHPVIEGGAYAWEVEAPCGFVLWAAPWETHGRELARLVKLLAGAGAGHLRRPALYAASARLAVYDAGGTRETPYRSHPPAADPAGDDRGAPMPPQAVTRLRRASTTFFVGTRPDGARKRGADRAVVADEWADGGSAAARKGAAAKLPRRHAARFAWVVSRPQKYPAAPSGWSAVAPALTLVYDPLRLAGAPALPHGLSAWDFGARRLPHAAPSVTVDCDLGAAVGAGEPCCPRAVARVPPAEGPPGRAQCESCRGHVLVGYSVRLPGCAVPLDICYACFCARVGDRAAALGARWYVPPGPGARGGAAGRELEPAAGLARHAGHPARRLGAAAVLLGPEDDPLLVVPREHKTAHVAEARALGAPPGVPVLVVGDLVWVGP